MRADSLSTQCGDLNGKEIHKTEDVCIRIADSLCHPAETNTVKQLHSNKNFFNKSIHQNPWRRKWQQRRLVGYSPWDHKESDMTEQLTHIHQKNTSKNWQKPNKLIVLFQLF